MHIELATAPSAADLKTISQGIQSYNQEHLPDQLVFEPDTRFAAFARNDQGDVVGGIRANAFGIIALSSCCGCQRKLVAVAWAHA